MHLFLVVFALLFVGAVAFGISRIKSAKTKAAISATAVKAAQSTAAVVDKAVSNAASAVEKKL